MTSRRPSPAKTRRLPGIVGVGILAVAAVIAVPLGHQLLASSSMTSTGASNSEGARNANHGPLGEADGAVPAGTTVYDDGVPGVAKLRPVLLRALRQAAADAEHEGVELLVNSGWRSPRYEQHLFDEAVAKYGSEAAAARWVATPSTSAHVAGDAVDIGPSRAAAWLSGHGARYGLCQIYGNEPWHYELRPAAVGRGCPPMYADATHDPRMQH